jgi:hypothetical protein
LQPLDHLGRRRRRRPRISIGWCAHAALIGTLQAGYTEFGYLSPVSRVITEREALLGVSLCGILDRPDVFLDPAVLRAGAAVVKAVNAVVARALGIHPAARTTCVKPEGTASLLLGTSSGLHPHHAQRYFRRVQANVHDPVYRHFRKHNPHMVEQSVYDPNGRTEVITFPVEGPDFRDLPRGPLGREASRIRPPRAGKLGAGGASPRGHVARAAPQRLVHDFRAPRRVGGGGRFYLGASPRVYRHRDAAGLRRQSLPAGAARRRSSPPRTSRSGTPSRTKASTTPSSKSRRTSPS